MSVNSHLGGFLSVFCYLFIHLLGRSYYKSNHNDKFKQKLILNMYECTASNAMILTFVVNNIFYFIVPESRIAIKDYATSWLANYFIIDIFMISKMTKSSFVHHIFGILIIILIKLDNRIDYDIYARLSLIELSTIFLNLRIILKESIEYCEKKGEEGDIIALKASKKIVEIIFVLSFIILRGLYMPYLLISNYCYFTNFEYVIRIFEAIGFIGLVIINLYWCKLIIAKINNFFVS